MIDEALRAMRRTLAYNFDEDTLGRYVSSMQRAFPPRKYKSSGLDYKVVFNTNGDLIRYFGPYQKSKAHKNQPNQIHFDALKFVKFDSGQSSTWVVLKNIEGRERYMFLKDFQDILLKHSITHGWVIGFFHYVRRGTAFRIKYMGEFIESTG